MKNRGLPAIRTEFVKVGALGLGFADLDIRRRVGPDRIEDIVGRLALDVGVYRVVGLLDTGLQDWRLYFAVANVNVIAVNPSAPFKDFGALLDAL